MTRPDLRRCPGARGEAARLSRDGGQDHGEHERRRGAGPRRRAHRRHLGPRGRSIVTTIAGRPIRAAPSPGDGRRANRAGRGAQGRGPPGRWPAGHRATARPRQAHRPRAARAPPRPGILRRDGHDDQTPVRYIRPGQPAPVHRRGRDGLGNDRRPKGLRLQSGLHDLRRVTGRGLR